MSSFTPSSPISTSPPSLDLPLGPFGKAATQLYEIGLSPVPCGGEDGKVPLLQGWNRTRRRPGPALIAKFGGANVGVATGELSSVTVVDLDDPSYLNMAIARFGETPLIVRTPRGGFHLWYRSSGERTGDLRSEGYPIDIRGINGVVLAPPSIRTSGVHAGKVYHFEKGDWSQLPNLPNMLPQPTNENSKYPVVASSVPAGRRNKTLYRFCLREAQKASSLEDLVAGARVYVGSRFGDLESSSFPDSEIRKTAASAWQCQQEGRNWFGQPSVSILSAAHEDFLNAFDTDAQVLFRVIHRANSQRETFLVSIRGMIESGRLAGWGRTRYVNARECLLKTGFLVLVKKGGRGKGDTDIFEFGPAVRKGTKEYLNVIEHPAAALSSRKSSQVLDEKKE